MCGLRAQLSVPLGALYVPLMDPADYRLPLTVFVELGCPIPQAASTMDERWILSVVADRGYVMRRHVPKPERADVHCGSP